MDLKLKGILCGLLFLPSLLFSQSFQEDLLEIAQDEQLMGMSVVKICDSEVDEIFHYGLRDNTRDLDIDDSTLFRIASISKTITATGAMILVDNGNLDLDADIGDYLGFECRNPLYPDVVITTRMVLSHTSSIQDGTGYSPFLSATYNGTNDIVPIQELLDPQGSYFTSNIFRTEQPGSYFAYSNLNFGVLATIMESASGQRFDVFMREHLFEPMGLACSYNVDDIENIDNLAVLYRNQGGWTPQVDNYQGIAPTPVELADYTPGGNGLRFAPQGGLRCSMPDLARLALLHLNEGYDSHTDQQIVSTATIQLMHTPVWTYNGSNGDNYFNLFNQWGLGIQQTTNTPMGDIVVPGTIFLGHPGEAYGLISDMYVNKEDGSGIIFLTNGAWNGFSFGNNSAFYTLEEAVFGAFADYTECAVNVQEAARSVFQIYPNPARSGDPVRISTNDLIHCARLSSSEGTLIESYTNIQGDLSLPNLAPGIYFLSYEINEQQDTLRIVIQ